MASHIFHVEAGEQGWIIRHGTVVAAQCADRESALQLAFALARGQRIRHGDEVIVRTHDSCAGESRHRLECPEEES